MKIRDARKQASRARVIEAARGLFEEVGFQATTVRMIAERAKLSPGGVFTTFEDKVAILCQILSDYRDQLFDEIERALPGLDGAARRRLEAVITMAHAHETPRLKLMLAYISASYTWSAQLEAEHKHLRRRMGAVMQRIVQDGLDRGEIKAGTDLDLLTDVLLSMYVHNYRAAHFCGLGVAELDARVSRQLDMVFGGIAAN